MRRRVWTALRALPRLRWFRPVAITLAGFAGLTVIGYVALKLTPDWFADDRFPDLTCRRPSDKDFKNCLDAAKARADDRRAVSTATLAILAGSIATVGAVLTGLSYRLNRAGQITERFTRAIDQLGSSELDIRLGGIYALERIARDSPDDHPQVIEVLTAYVREHAPWPPAPAQTTIPLERSDARALDVRVAAIEAIERIARGPGPAHAEDQTDAATDAATASNAETAATPPPKPPTDVQATLAVLGRRNRSQDALGFRLDLRETDLRGVALVGEERCTWKGLPLSAPAGRPCGRPGAPRRKPPLPGESESAAGRRAGPHGAAQMHGKRRPAG